MINSRAEGILLIVLVIGLSLVFQVQMKLFSAELAAALTKANSVAASVTALLEVSLTWRGLFVALVACAQFIVWLMALARLDLSLAIPMLSLGLIVVAWSGGVWLGEELNWVRVAGLCATALGICLVMYS
jgi:drug/metabolite transporter (DMT)-like permease